MGSKYPHAERVEQRTIEISCTVILESHSASNGLCRLIRRSGGAFLSSAVSACFGVRSSNNLIFVPFIFLLHP